MERPSVDGSLEVGGATEVEVEGMSASRGGGGGAGDGDAATNFTSCRPSSQLPPNFPRQLRTPQNVPSQQPPFSLMEARPPPPPPQQPHPSQTQRQLGSLRWHQRPKEPQPYAQSSTIFLHLQNQLKFYQREIASQTPRQVGEQSQVANQSTQADSASQQQQREDDIDLHQLFSSPEAIQSMLNDRDKLIPLLEHSPVLRQMLRDRLSKF